MKTTVVPAQITTIEDRIAGSLGISQLMLLVAPIFISCALFIVLPPNFNSSLYKLVLMAGMAVISAILAIRIKGKIVLFWLITLLRYYRRPRFYVFNNHSLHGRIQPATPKIDQEPEVAAEPKHKKERLPLTTAEVVELEDLIANPNANVSFERGKKGFNVRFTEIK